jgi:hypothetical protein
VSLRLEIGEFLWRKFVAPARRRLSSVAVDDRRVRIRNFPGRSHSFRVDAVKQFDWRTDAVGHYAVLRQEDGTEVDVLALDKAGPERLEKLNERLEDGR